MLREERSNFGWLGQKVRDNISGFEGTVLEQNERLYGPAQLFVVPYGLCDGKPVPGVWFEIGRIEAVDGEAHVGFAAHAL